MPYLDKDFVQWAEDTSQLSYNEKIKLRMNLLDQWTGYVQNNVFNPQESQAYIRYRRWIFTRCAILDIMIGGYKSYRERTE